MRIIPQFEPWLDEKETTAISDYMKSGGWLTEFKKTEDVHQNLITASNTYPITYKVRKGKVGGYKDYLTKEDIEYIKKRISLNLNKCFRY